MSVQQGLISGAKWEFFLRWYSRVLGLGSTLVLVRLLEVEDFGVIALATFFVSLFTAISQAGAVRYILTHDDLSDDHISSIWSLNLALRVVFAVLLAITAGYIADYSNTQELKLVLQVISINLALTGLRNVGLDLQEKQFNFRYLTIAKIIAKTVATVVSLSLAVLWQNYWALVWAMVTLQLIEVVSGYLLCQYRPYWCSRYWKEQWYFSSSMVLVSVLGYMRSRIDIVMLGNLVSTHAVGLYNTALEFSSLPMSEVAQPLHRGLLAGFSSVKNNLTETQMLLRNQLAINCLILLPSAFGTYAVAEPFVKVVLGQQWIEAIPVIQYLTWLMMSSIFYMPLVPALWAKKNYVVPALLDIVIIASVVFGFLLFREENVDVLALVRAAVAGVFCVILVFVYRHWFHLSVSFFASLFTVVLLPSLVMYGAVSWCVSLNLGDGVKLVSSVLLGVTLYIPLLLLSSYVARHHIPEVWHLCSAVLHHVGKKLSKRKWRLQ